MTERRGPSRPTRLAGAGRGPDEALVTWSLAEGARGRRWRSTRTLDGALVSVLLLEVTPTGRPSRLELTTAAGLLTLHPTAGETELHGNVVSPDGVRHLAFAWSPDHVLVVDDEPIAATALAGQRGRAGRSGRLTGVRVGAGLAVERVTFEPPPGLPEASPLPVLRGAATWPLERS